MNQEFPDSFKFEEPILTDCRPQQIALDTSSYMNNKIIYPDSNLEGLNCIRLSMTNGLGYSIVEYQSQKYFCLIN